jgi:putative phosphoribosyl transferase
MSATAERDDNELNGRLQFKDRQEAGRLLGLELHRRGIATALLMAVPRGGVPVAVAAAEELPDSRVDVVLVRKIGHPDQPEWAIGALAEGGNLILNSEAVVSHQIPTDRVQQIIDRQENEIRRHRDLYRRGRLPIDVRGQTVVIIDDGTATGSTILAATKFLRRRGAKEVVAALPTCSVEARQTLEKECNQVICLRQPEPFVSVGSSYRDFDQVSDCQVIEGLDQAAEKDQKLREISYQLSGDRQALLESPPEARGLILLADWSAGQAHMTGLLHRESWATLRIDQPDSSGGDPEAAAGRLADAWAESRKEESLKGLPTEILSGNGGMQTAFRVAALLGPKNISGLVCRDGQGVVSESLLQAISCPVLFVVGSENRQSLAFSREAIRVIGPQAEITVVPGCTDSLEGGESLITDNQIVSWLGERSGS